MRSLHSCLVLSFTLAASLALSACGGSPTSPSSNGIVVQGTVLSGSGVSTSDLTASSGSPSSSSRITVTVQGTGISTTVSASGTFVLEGLQPGPFTLVFTKDGHQIGTVTLTVTSPTAAVKMVVEVTDSGVVLVELKVDDKDATGSSTSSCLVSGARAGQPIELEGDVASGAAAEFKLDVGGQRARDLVDVVAAASATWQCVGQSGPDCKTQLKVGAKVHVRGTLTDCSPTAAQVMATEVKVQKP
jgi:hypothetical protein